MHQKKVPLRKCTGCGEMKPKKELIRVVKAPDQKNEAGETTGPGEISLDLTGKKPGRGAYVCKSLGCLRAALREESFSSFPYCITMYNVYIFGIITLFLVLHRSSARCGPR